MNEVQEVLPGVLLGLAEGHVAGREAPQVRQQGEVCPELQLRVGKGNDFVPRRGSTMGPGNK